MTRHLHPEEIHGLLAEAEHALTLEAKFVRLTPEFCKRLMESYSELFAAVDAVWLEAGQDDREIALNRIREICSNVMGKTP